MIYYKSIILLKRGVLMIRTIMWFICFWIKLIVLIPDSFKVKALKESGEIAQADLIVNKIVKNWAKSLVLLSGCEIKVIGEENIPKDKPVLFVSNHQGNFDIPILLGFIEKPKAFVAKEELEKFPLVSTWMKYMNCVFMNRNNSRESIKAINEGIKILKEGYSLVIFPEGTRSKDGNLGEFKAGALKLATKSGVSIIPVTIKGSNQIMKKGSFVIRPSKVEVIISAPVDMNEAFSKDTKELTQTVKNIIDRNLQ